MRLKSLAVKMQIALNILFICVMLPLSVSIYLTLDKSLYQRSAEELSNTTEMVRNQVDLYIESAVKNYLRALAEKGRDSFQYFYNRFRAGEISEQEAYRRAGDLILDPVYGKIGTTGYLAGVSTDGILTIHPISPGVDASGFEFMQGAMAMKNGYLEYDWANKGEETARKKAGYISLFAPWDVMIFASSYTAEFLHLVEIDDLKGCLKDLKIGKAGYPMVLTSRGDVIFHPVLDGRNVMTDGSNQTLNDLIEESRSNPDKVVSRLYLSEVDGKERLGTAAYDDKMDWFILTSLPTAEIYGPLYRVRNILILGCIIAFGAMNLVILLLLRRVLAPLKEVRRIVSLFSQGDISQKIEVDTKDEIGTIALEVNVLTGKMSEIIRRMQNDVTTINGSIQDLSSSSSEISTTSNEQASAVKEIVSTMEDSDSLSKGIEQRIQEVAQISEHAREIVTAGVNHVEESLVKMEEIKISNNDTITGIRALSEKIEAIWEIVNIINSIADQTKIIAFNAELEASAAGDAGKNFQIVASEIRRLANSTVNSTTEIKNKINEIQHSSDRLITASEDGTNKIEEGGKLTETLHSTFEEILETSEISADSAKEISSSIRQQVFAFEQILLTLKQISEGINNFVVSTKSTSETTGKLKLMADGMKEFLESYKTAPDRGAVTAFEEDDFETVG